MAQTQTPADPVRTASQTPVLSYTEGELAQLLARQDFNGVHFPEVEAMDDLAWKAVVTVVKSLLDERLLDLIHSGVVTQVARLTYADWKATYDAVVAEER